ncbi:MAG: 5-(carboxyamino)imidazole ribonucleotide synthase [Pseudolabrys sp.]
MRSARGRPRPSRSGRSNDVLKTGATIGILGGGQLGRMLALAAAKLGFRTHVYSPEENSCAFDVAHAITQAAYEDETALAQFAQVVDVVTYEFENVPGKTAAFLSKRKAVLPDPGVLETTQDRLVEKDFVTSLKIPTAPYAPVHSATQLAEAVDKVGLPAVLKTRTLGYDGKGQIMLAKGGDPVAAWRSLKNAPCILEGFVKFQREVSVVAARDKDGKVVCFDVTENQHQNHILKVSRVPARLSQSAEREARRIATRIAEALGYVGVLAVEMFAVKDGKATGLLVNEIAPRVHNSGHWTLDGATVSQFEQHIRAIAGLPLARPVRLGRVEMTNLIGAEIGEAARWMAVPGVSVHVYGKKEARPGRKMGHVTKVRPER